MQHSSQLSGSSDLAERPSSSAIAIGRPIMIDPAFDDPALMLDLIDRNAPYLQTASRNGGPPSAASFDPWFRGTLAANEEPMAAGVEPAFRNPNFIDAAKLSFQAPIVRPLSLTINFYAPMPAGRKHTDLPFFRGAMDRRLGGIRYAMGVSGLFRHWEVLAASAIAWFYTGEGGDLDYWPDGPDMPPATVAMPQWNVALVSDNEHMFHRVAACGAPADHLPEGAADPAMILCRNGEGWTIDKLRIGSLAYSPSQVRTSVLWKALVFEDDAAERAYDSHSDDLTSGMIIDIFRDDLARRGISSRMPADLVRDPDWMQLMMEHYPTDVGYFSLK